MDNVVLDMLDVKHMNDRMVTAGMSFDQASPKTELTCENNNDCSRLTIQTIDRLYYNY